MSKPRTYYEILEVSSSASGDEIKIAYKKLALKYHPDRNPGDDNAVAQFKEVNEAYQTLSDMNKKAKYDFTQNMSQSHVGRQGFGNPFADSIFSDLFVDFGFPKSTNFWTGNHANASPGPGDDITADLELSFEESLLGCKKTINVQGPRPVTCTSCNGKCNKPGGRSIFCTNCGGIGKSINQNGQGVRNCHVCGGNGRLPLDKCETCKGVGKTIYTKEVTIQVPAGVSSDHQLRLAGLGTPGHPPGSLFVKIKINANDKFWRQGDEIHTKKQLSIKEAILGGDIILSGHDKIPIHLKIPSGTQAGDIIRVVGRGVKHPVTKKNGDFVVHMEIIVPKKINLKAQRLLEEFMVEVSKSVTDPD